METITEKMDQVAHSGVRGTLIQIVDPAEEAFPYSGRTEFRDPESGNKLTYGRAEQLQRDYRVLFSARQDSLKQRCSKMGWTHLVHHTDQLASTILVATHRRLSGQLGMVR